MKREPAGRWIEESGRGRAQREDYTEDDGRVDPEECHHTQFLDLSVPGYFALSVGRCLDCGHTIWNGSKILFEDHPKRLLDDDELIKQRGVHRAIWFYGLTMPDNVAPGS